jgi:hypothetical protein
MLFWSSSTILPNSMHPPRRDKLPWTKSALNYPSRSLTCQSRCTIMALPSLFLKFWMFSPASTCWKTTNSSSSSSARLQLWLYFVSRRRLQFELWNLTPRQFIHRLSDQTNQTTKRTAETRTIIRALPVCHFGLRFPLRLRQPHRPCHFGFSARSFGVGQHSHEDHDGVPAKRVDGLSHGHDIMFGYTFTGYSHREQVFSYFIGDGALGGAARRCRNKQHGAAAGCALRFKQVKCCDEVTCRRCEQRLQVRMQLKRLLC